MTDRPIFYLYAYSAGCLLLIGWIAGRVDEKRKERERG